MNEWIIVGVAVLATVVLAGGGGWIMRAISRRSGGDSA